MRCSAVFGRFPLRLFGMSYPIVLRLPLTRDAGILWMLSSDPESGPSESSGIPLGLYGSSLVFSTAQLSGGTHVGLPGPTSVAGDEWLAPSSPYGGNNVFGETLRKSPLEGRMPLRFSCTGVVEKGSLNSDGSRKLECKFGLRKLWSEELSDESRALGGELLLAKPLGPAEAMLKSIIPFIASTFMGPFSTLSHRPLLVSGGGPGLRKEPVFCSGKGGIGGRNDGCSESSESFRRWALLGRLLSFENRFNDDFVLRSSPEAEELLCAIPRDDSPSSPDFR